MSWYKSKACEVCGAMFNGSYQGQRTCSRACGVKINPYIRARKPKVRTIRIRWCTQCGAWFVSKGPQLTCSEACALENKRAKDRAYNNTRPKSSPLETACLTCGQGSYPFPPRNCPACKRRHKRQGTHRRARLKRGVETEPYTLTEIAKRDHNYCGLCHKRVAMTQHVPHPKAPTVDHVLPLACGGDDTRANVQLAHYACNVRKGIGGSQQLALVG